MIIDFTLEELKDLNLNLDQCCSKGYIDYGDPSYEAWMKIQRAIEYDN